MLKRVIGSKIIRIYDENGDFIKEINVIEFNSALLDWCAISTIVLIGIVLMGHYG